MKKFVPLLLSVVLFGCAVQPETPEKTVAYSTEDFAQSTVLETVGQRDLPKVRVVDVLGGVEERHFARYGQCQLAFKLSGETAAGLPLAEAQVKDQIHQCLATALKHDVNVLILPELSLSLPESERLSLIEVLSGAAQRNNMIIIAGSYYDKNQQSRIPVIGPGWQEYGYKMKPSRFESSPRYGFGMQEGDELLLLKTEFGRIMPLTCVDLISDSAQYVVRNLSNRGKLDVLANINYNPAAWEFLIEANSITRRHPVFVSITNASQFASTKTKCEQQGDFGYCAGNSAIFASLRTKSSACPNCAASVLDLVPAPFMNGEKRHLAYDRMAAVIPAGESGLLMYDLNLRLVREPLSTNAPDQGYPPIKNIQRVLF